jgi:diguanylate cyclase (GGDEF)-like protein
MVELSFNEHPVQLREVGGESFVNKRIDEITRELAKLQARVEKLADVSSGDPELRIRQLQNNQEALREVLAQLKSVLVDLPEGSPAPAPGNIAHLEAATGGYLLTDLHGLIQIADRSMTEILHIPASQLIGKSLEVFITPEHRGEYTEKISQFNHGNRVLEWKTDLQDPQGVTIPAMLTVSGAVGNNEQVYALHWLLRDLRAIQMDVPAITETRPPTGRRTSPSPQPATRPEKPGETPTERHNRQLSALHSATSMLLSTLDLEPLLGQIIDAATTAISTAEKGILYLIARETGQLEIRATMGYSDPRIQKFAFPGTRGYVVKAVQEKQPLIINEVQTEPFIPFQDNIPEIHAIRSAIVAPLLMEDQVLGALALTSAKRAAFTEDDLFLVVSFAATATAAIRNAQLHAEVQKQAITDTLTNLYNRRGFFEIGRREIERSRRFNRPVTAIMVDVDRLKQINDTYGHPVGDQVLIAFSSRINKNIRDIDVMGRYGGDEFCILLPETDLFIASQVAERLRHCVADSATKTDSGPLFITGSFGVSKLSSDMPDLAVLLSKADAAMYIAKQSGGNRVEIG